ncbi:MAG: right-handed parallel beta-helix repeat-containing protein [Candidatus Dojkabacteria bacterium]|nr:right-handed parallel beta-helix repeat-containing protein [Candidatus Dojkabacteria bacterium]
MLNNKKITVLILVILIILGISSVLLIVFGGNLFNFTSANFNTYYIDSQNGNDTNSGDSESRPWKTLKNLERITLKPGDRVLLKRGSFFNEELKINGSGTNRDKIVIDTYGSGNIPIINGTRLTNASEWQPSTQRANVYRIKTFAGNIIVNDKKGTEKKNINSLTNDGDYYKDYYSRVANTDGHLYVYLSRPISEYKLEISTINNLLTIKNNSHIIIRNIHFRGANQHNILITNDDPNRVDSQITIENIVSSESRFSGIYLQHTRSNTIRNSEIRDNGQEGIRMLVREERFSNLGYNLIESNKVYNNVMPGILSEGYTSGIPMRGNVIKNNIIFNNGDGIYIRYTQDTFVLNNTVYSNNNTNYFGEGDGIPLQSSSNNVIAGNVVFKHRNSGLHIWGGQPTAEKPKYGRTDNNVFYNNISYENSKGFFISSSYSDNNKFYYNLVYKNTRAGLHIGHANSKNNEIFNNTIVKNEKSIQFYMGSEISNRYYNNIFALNKSGFSGHTQPIQNFSSNAYFQEDFSRLRSSSIRDVDQNAILDDPLFVDPDNDNYRLKSNSPLIDKGIRHNIEVDLEGKRIINLPDIGAFEFNTSSNPNPNPTSTTRPTATSTPVPTLSPTPTISNNTPSPSLEPIPSAPITSTTRPTPTERIIIDNSNPAIYLPFDTAITRENDNSGSLNIKFKSVNSPVVQERYKRLRLDATKQQYLTTDLTNNDQIFANSFTIMFYLQPIRIDRGSGKTIWGNFINRFGGFRVAVHGYDDRISFEYKKDRDSTTQSVTADYTLPLNSYTHVAFVYDKPTGALKIYVNGQENKSVNIGSDVINLANKTYHIGYNPYNNTYYNGYLDEFKVYDRALTVDEIRSFAGQTYNN